MGKNKVGYVPLLPYVYDRALVRSGHWVIEALEAPWWSPTEGGGGGGWVNLTHPLSPVGWSNFVSFWFPRLYLYIYIFYIFYVSTTCIIVFGLETCNVITTQRDSCNRPMNLTRFTSVIRLWFSTLQNYLNQLGLCEGHNLAGGLRTPKSSCQIVRRSRQTTLFCL